jgi:hypothetical protein
MPTSQSEAQKIVAISQEYIPLEKMIELFIRLDKEVGSVTTNDSLKKSLQMMRFWLIRHFHRHLFGCVQHGYFL